MRRTEIRVQGCPFLQVKARCLLEEVGFIALIMPLTEQDPEGSKFLFLHSLSELAMPLGTLGRSKPLKGREKNERREKQTGRGNKDL